MGKTLDAIKDRSTDDSRSYHPGELADGRFADLTNPPSLAALKLHEVLFKAAGAAVADDRWHQIDLAELRAIGGMKNYDRRGLIGLFKELRSVVMEYDTATETVIAGLLDIAKVEFEDGNGPTVVRWRFGQGFREIVDASNYWAMIDRGAALAMTSRYSLRLHELVSLRANLHHKTSEQFALGDLRARLGVPEGKLKAWGSLAQKALQPAVSEVNQLSRFDVSITPVKRGRSVIAVDLAWRVKHDLTATKSEIKRHSAGRKARRTGTVETVDVADAIAAKANEPQKVKAPAFPEGGITFNNYWVGIAREFAPGWDPDLVASGFRTWWAGKGRSLDEASVEKAFAGFAKQMGSLR